MASLSNKADCTRGPPPTSASTPRMADTISTSTPWERRSMTSSSGVLVEGLLGLAKSRGALARGGWEFEFGSILRVLKIAILTISGLPPFARTAFILSRTFSALNFSASVNSDLRIFPLSVGLGFISGLFAFLLALPERRSSSEWPLEARLPRLGEPSPESLHIHLETCAKPPNLFISFIFFFFFLSFCVSYSFFSYYPKIFHSIS